jgi:glycosyltransferase involved in cell wall biosynthesis
MTVRPDLPFLLTNITLHLADKIFTPSVHLSKIIGHYYHLHPNKLVTISNAVDHATIKTKKIPSSLVFIGRLVKWKNVALLLESLASLKRQKVHFSCKIVGSGPEERELKNLAASLGVGKDVTFMGRLPTSSALREIAGSEILALPSTYEGQPHVVLEAMAQQTAVVVSDAAGNCEVVKNGQTGLVFKLGAKNDLTAKLKALLTNQSLRNTLVKNARSYVVAQHSWRATMNSLVALLHEGTN